MNRSWRAAETWHCERPSEAIGEDAALVAVEGPALMGSWKEAEAWNHKESLLVKVQSSRSEDANVLDM